MNLKSLQLETKVKSRAHNLLLPMDGSRGCRDAGVPYEHCACAEWASLPGEALLGWGRGCILSFSFTAACLKNQLRGDSHLDNYSIVGSPYLHCATSPTSSRRLGN